MPHIRLSPRAIVLSALAIGAIPAASAASFPSVVRAVLDGQSDGRLASMLPLAVPVQSRLTLAHWRAYGNRLLASNH